MATASSAVSEDRAEARARVRQVCRLVADLGDVLAPRAAFLAQRGRAAAASVGT